MNVDYRMWEVEKDAPPGSFNAHAPYIDNGTARLDPARYYDPKFMQAEWDHMWTRVWLLAGVTCDLPEPGDFFVFKIRHESFIVVRGEDGEIHAHYNVCPHRGTIIAQTDFGNMSKFTCPFHGWEFAHDGSNVKITDKESYRPEVLCHGTDLTSVRCETRSGLIFITMNDDAPPLDDYLGDFVEQVELYELGDMTTVTHTQTEWDSNWKVGADAFMECYHVPFIHPQSSPMVDYRCQLDLYPNGMTRMYMMQGVPGPPEVCPDQETVNDTLKFYMKEAGVDPETFTGTAQDVRAAIQKSKRERAAKHGRDLSRYTDVQLSDTPMFGIFPNVQVSCEPEAVLIHRWLPHPENPNRFWYDTLVLYRPIDDTMSQVPVWMGVPEGTPAHPEERPEVIRQSLDEPREMSLILDQDASLMPWVQAGVRSRGFKGAVWSEHEVRLRHLHAELDRYLNGEK